MNVEKAKKALEKLGFDDVEFTGRTSQAPTGETFVLYETSFPDAPRVVLSGDRLRLEPWDYPESSFS